MACPQLSPSEKALTWGDTRDRSATSQAIVKNALNEHERMNNPGA